MNRQKAVLGELEVIWW